MIINNFLFVRILEKINEMEYYFCGEIEKLEILIINFFSQSLFSVYLMRKEIF